MNQLFYNIAGGIVQQIRREKRPTISEVIVRGKRIILGLVVGVSVSIHYGREISEYFSPR